MKNKELPNSSLKPTALPETSTSTSDAKTPFFFSFCLVFFSSALSRFISFS
jgi:hypothetical protein